MVEVTLIFRYFLLRKLSHTVLDSTQSVLRDMTSQEHCRHPQGMNFKDITKDTTQDTILDTLRYVKKCSIATVGLYVKPGPAGALNGPEAFTPVTSLQRGFALCRVSPRSEYIFARRSMCRGLPTPGIPTSLHSFSTHSNTSPSPSIYL